MHQAPTPTQIRDARKAAGLTQTKAAALISATVRAWRSWESQSESTARAMPISKWRLFLLLTNGHNVPTFGE
jgi:DNA (cytosine-5)-methyltransferase 1